MVTLNEQLLHRIRGNLGQTQMQKRAMEAMPPGPPPNDPNAMAQGGMPPPGGAPAGAPPGMDPNMMAAMMGGAGAPPMDPAMMGGAPAGAPPMDPNMLAAMMGGAAPGAGAPPPPPPAEGGASEEQMATMKQLNEKIDSLSEMVSMIAQVVGIPQSGSPEEASAGAPEGQMEGAQEQGPSPDAAQGQEQASPAEQAKVASRRVNHITDMLMKLKMNR